MTRCCLANIWAKPPGLPIKYLDRGMRLVDSPLSWTLSKLLGQPVRLAHRSGSARLRRFLRAAPRHVCAEPRQRLLQSSRVATRLHVGAGRHSGNLFRWLQPVRRARLFPERRQDAPASSWRVRDTRCPISRISPSTRAWRYRSRWSDADIVAFERYDFQDVSGDGFTNVNATTVLFAMNAQLRRDERRHQL